MRNTPRLPIDRKLLVELVVDTAGLGGLVLVCTGVYLLWGSGWACIAAGAPILTAYVWRELGAPRKGRG